MSSPSLGPDGSIHVLVFSGGPNSGISVVSLNPDGTERWRHRIADAEVLTSPRALLPTPSVDPAGDVWVLHRDRVVRLSASGTPRWTFTFPADLGSLTTQSGVESLGGAVAVDGSYYFTHQSFLVRLSAGGTEVWRTRRGLIAKAEPVFQYPADYNGAPAIDADGRPYASCIACGSQEGTSGVAAFDPADGSVLWVVGREEPASEISGPVLNGAGRVYSVVASALIGASLDGSLLWPPVEGSATTTVPLVLTGDGKLVTCRGQSLVMVSDADGTSSDAASVPGSCASVSVVGETTWVGFASSTSPTSFAGGLMVLGRDGTQLATYGADGLDITKLPAFGQGVVYAVTKAGLVTAFPSALATPVSGPWPVAGGDAGYTRRAAPRR